MISHIGPVDTPDIPKLLKDFVQGFNFYCRECNSEWFIKVWARYDKQKDKSIYQCCNCKKKYRIPKKMIMHKF